MEHKDVPATDESYHSLVTHLRSQITSSTKGKGVDVGIVESILDILMPESILEVFKIWSEQKPKLEEVLITTFLDSIVLINMELGREKNNRYQYALATEGRCLQRHKGVNSFGFIREKPLAKPDLYTYDELMEGWRDIFELDMLIDRDENLRDKYAPRCRHGGVDISALVLTTQHQLRIVDQYGKYVRGTNISFCRSKSGVGHLFKLAEYLTGLRADGRERESIDDYLATLSREQETYEEKNRWINAMKVIRRIADVTHSDLSDVLRLRGYTRDEADELKKVLERDPDVGGFVRRPDFDFYVESLPKDKEGKFGEIWLSSYDKNKICWQVYDEASYTRIHGSERTKHIQYKTEREHELLRGFTPWHWSIMRRLAPYFVDPYIQDAFERIYETYLSLEHFKPHNSVRR